MVCMVCGQPADDTKSQSFYWHTPWIHLALLCGLLPWLILALVLRKTAVVKAPLCPRHRSHFLLRTLAICGLVLLLIVGSIGLGVLVSEMERNGSSGEWGWSFPVFLIVVIVIIVVVTQMFVRPARITDDTITLKGVHPDFVTAVEKELAVEEEDDRPRGRLRDAYDDDGDRPRRRRDRDDDDEDDRPRRRRDRDDEE
jgi:hypothetical protein